MSQSTPGPDAVPAWDLETEQRVDVLEELLAIGTALSGANDLDTLLRFILDKSREVTKSDAGSVFLVDRKDPAQPKLVFKIAQNDSLPNLHFEETRLAIREDSLAGHVALSGKPLNIKDAYSPPAGIPFNSEFDRLHGYRTVSLLVLPMLNQQREVIGVLQLINRKKSSRLRLTPDNAVEYTQPYSPLESRILMSLASQAAISIERHELQKNVEDLFEGFVHASVSVIEARDPATAGHSERVARLTVRLAEEVSSIRQGPLRDLSFNDKQLQEIRYASLLHDFGKVGVPEAVLLKAKKLYPEQLESLRYRFALARRDLEHQRLMTRIAHMTGHPRCAPDCMHAAADDDELQRRQSELDGLWDLLMQLNEPQVLSTRQSEEILGRIQALAAYRFHGISNTDEPLVTERELKQLLISRGSLTEAERQAIESHVSQSFEFLKRLPWTKTLLGVPDIAHGHHEKLDGSGYPLGLKREQIPVQSQMMAVSDIFDALSASDRPYKIAVPHDRALAILREEAIHSHINPDLVQVFEERRVFEVVPAGKR